MDAHTQDQYIQKKLLYKFDKKLDQVEQEYIKHLFPSGDNPLKMKDEALVEEIINLEFINFKYRTALLSSNKDLIHNEEQLLEQDSKIQTLKDQIKHYEEELQKALVIKQNKLKYNQTGAELMKYDKKTIMDEKLNAVRAEIKEISDKYNQDMATYIMREKYLKASLSALQHYFIDIEKSKIPEKSPEAFRSSDKEMGEDEGQIL